MKDSRKAVRPHVLSLKTLVLPNMIWRWHVGDAGTVAHKFDPPNNHHIIHYKSQP